MLIKGIPLGDASIRQLRVPVDLENLKLLEFLNKHFGNNNNRINPAERLVKSRNEREGSSFSKTSGLNQLDLKLEGVIRRVPLNTKNIDPFIAKQTGALCQYMIVRIDI